MSSLTQPSKIIIIHYAGHVEVIVSNPHPIITNRIIIVDSIFKIGNKVLDEILFPKGNGLQLLGVCLVAQILYIRIMGDDKIFNTIISIVD